MTRSLTVASWNVLADAYVRPEYYPRVDPRWLQPGARLPGIVERLRGLDADLICLQELEPAAFEALVEALPGHHGEYAPKGLGRPDGLAIFSTVRGRAEVLHFSDGSGHVALLLELPGLTIATTHLKWSASTQPAPERWGLKQADELLARRTSGPWIICGDLNAAPGSLELQRFLTAGFRDAHPPGAFTANPNGRLQKIDHLLYAELSEATPHPVHPLTATTPVPSAAEPSDHLLLSATFTLRPTAAS